MPKSTLYARLHRSAERMIQFLDQPDVIPFLVQNELRIMRSLATELRSCDPDAWDQHEAMCDFVARATEQELDEIIGPDAVLQIATENGETKQ